MKVRHIDLSGNSPIITMECPVCKHPTLVFVINLNRAKYDKRQDSCCGKIYFMPRTVIDSVINHIISLETNTYKHKLSSTG